jgi:hypothetical protein
MKLARQVQNKQPSKTMSSHPFIRGETSKYLFVSRRTPAYENKNKAEAVGSARILQQCQLPDKNPGDISKSIWKFSLRLKSFI